MEHAIEQNEQINIANLSKEELMKLQEQCEQGDPFVREQIILAYLPLVSSIAKKYSHGGVPYDDLYQEGCYGLIKAVENYKCSFNASFATYFSFYILKYIKKALISQNLLYPVVYKENFYYDVHKYIRAFDKLSEKYEHPPSDDEMAEELNVSLKKIQLLRISAHMFLYHPSLLHFADLHQYPKNLISKSAEKTYFSTEHNLDLSSLGVRLTVREREVVSRKLGFTQTGTVESTAQISAALGLSFETIRTTYLMALKKIKDKIEENGLDISTIEI